ncbi:MAG: vWA domain-containing protein [Acidobacteriota bacterium]
MKPGWQAARRNHMRSATLALIFTVPLLAQAPILPPLDIVVLAEDSVLVANLLHSTRLDVLDKDDRIALMAFSKGSTVKLPFTGDFTLAMKAIRKLDGKRGGRNVLLWDAVVAAAKLFPGPPDATRKRAIVVLFSKEHSGTRETPERVRMMLQQAGISLSAAEFGDRYEVAKATPMPPVTPPNGNPRNPPATQQNTTIGNPPTMGNGVPPKVWGEGVPVKTATVMPAKTAEAVRDVAATTGGLFSESKWDFAAVVKKSAAR